MDTRVTAIGFNATVAEAIAILSQHHVSEAPVVNDNGQLVGVISELALLDVIFDPAVKDAPVSKFMTIEVQSVNPDVPLSHAAKMFAFHSFQRIPVVEAGNLVGVLARRDLMNYAIQTSQLLTDPLIELIPSLAPNS